MVAKIAPKKAAKKAAANNKVKKTITKTEKTKDTGVTKDFEVDEDARHTGKVTFYDVKRGFGFIQLSESGVVPDDKVMVYWRSIKSEDRWPFLKKDLEVELALTKKREGRDKWAIKAKDVTLPGGEDIALQEEKDGKREYVGNQNMRYLGNVKFFDFKKGFGYVTLQEGYDIPDEVPKELRVGRDEINAGEDCPRLSPKMEVEFGIAKNLKGQYTCYNMTLPGGQEVSRSIAEGRDNVTDECFEGEVAFWSRAGSYGMIAPAKLNKFPDDMQKTMKKDLEKRKKKAGKDGKDIKMAIYFRRGDKADPTAFTKKGQKVSYKLYMDKQGVGASEVTCI